MSIVHSPNKSTRRLALENNLKQSTVVQLIKEVGLRDFKATFVQNLSPDDKIHRQTFSMLWLDKLQFDPIIEDRVLWTDEASFNLNGTVNRHNYAYYAYENPNLLIPVLQKSASVHVWIGICSQGLVGPFFFEGNINADSYLNMLQEQIIPALQQFENWGEFYWQQDGAPPHWALRVREYLNDIFGEKWIGRDGPIRWPPRSPDLTPCDFFVWGHLRNMVYSSNPLTPAQLCNSIEQSSHRISQEMCQNACESVADRLQKCIGLEGGQVVSSHY